MSLKFFKIKNYEETPITLYFQNHEPPLQTLHPKQGKIHHCATKKQRKENVDVRNAFTGVNSTMIYCKNLCNVTMYSQQLLKQKRLGV
jgi:hypothetical protein